MAGRDRWVSTKPASQRARRSSRSAMGSSERERSPPPAPRARGVVAAGIYEGAGPETALAPLPVWNRAPIEEAIPRTRVLDLRDGTLRTYLDAPDGEASTVTFSSLARPGTAVLVAEGAAFEDDRAGPLGRPLGAEHGRDGARTWARGPRQRRRRGRSIGADRANRRPPGCGSNDSSPTPPTRGRHLAPRPALEALEAAERVGVETLLAEQRSAWARRWSVADIRIEGDPELQRAGALLPLPSHGFGCRPVRGRSRREGLSGLGYRGHVFWDTDVFVLPFLAATHPPAARALVGYRMHRLDAARAAAARHGFEGARFPWESADSGEDVTPASFTDSTGQLIRVLTGRAGRAHHRRRRLGRGAVPELERRRRRWVLAASSLRDRSLLGVARTPRFRRSSTPRGVIGPDEYHENVDDNAFTNTMARWNLRQAADVGRSGAEEASHSRRCAAASSTGTIRQAAAMSSSPATSASSRSPSPTFPVASIPFSRSPGAPAADPAHQAGRRSHAPPARPGSRTAGLSAPTSTGTSPDDPRLIAFGAGDAAALARAGRLDDALAYLRKSATIDLYDRDETLTTVCMSPRWEASARTRPRRRRPRAPRSQPGAAPASAGRLEALEFQVVVHDAAFRFRVLPTG